MGVSYVRCASVCSNVGTNVYASVETCVAYVLLKAYTTFFYTVNHTRAHLKCGETTHAFGPRTPSGLPAR